MYEALFQDLEQAEEYIHLQAYIFAADNVLDRLTELLIRKAKEGVTIRIIYDHLGSYSVPKGYWSRMRSVGIQVYAFMRVAFPLLSTTVNYRNHRKIVVIDGAIGYVGGMNFAQRYLTGNELGRLARHPFSYHRCSSCRSTKLLPHRLVHGLSQSGEHGSLLRSRCPGQRIFPLRTTSSQVAPSAIGAPLSRRSFT